ncbi:MAG: DUF456 domain-containing protein [Bacteroidia bacterium]
MIDWIITLLGLAIIVVGFIGCFIPVLPGPPIAWIALPLMYLTSEGFADINTTWFLILTLLTIVVTVIDYLLPMWGTKYSGGTKAGTWGSTIGLIIGLFFPPIGIIVGPFLGALIGELMAGQDQKTALKSGIGAFVGFLLGTVAKMVVVFLIGYQFLVWVF